MQRFHDRVAVRREAGIATVALSRPDKLNALDHAMIDGLIEAGASLHDDKSLRAVVLHGEGRAFCAGLDFKSFMAMGDGEAMIESFMRPHPGSPANRAQQCAYTFRQIPVPVVAAVQGPCFGGGLQLALAADLRILAPDAELSVMEIKWGLIPDMTGSVTLRELVRLDVVKELTFTGRRVPAEECVQIGLGTRLSNDPLAEAQRLAAAIAKQSPDAIRNGKRLLDQTRHVPEADALALEAKLQREIIAKPNQLEAVMAGMQKRDGNFADPLV
jgi:enoyl-CoA hydratase/carnithine racemase